MRLFEALADIFISVFGITQPSEQMRRRAAMFIMGLLALVVVGLSVLGVVLYRVMNGATR
ncbi:MAG: hypothetical protein V4555_05435 [Acidobacteriota bacterium]